MPSINNSLAGLVDRVRKALNKITRPEKRPVPQLAWQRIKK